MEKIDIIRNIAELAGALTIGASVGVVEKLGKVEMPLSKIEETLCYTGLFCALDFRYRPHDVTSKDLNKENIIKHSMRNICRLAGYYAGRTISGLFQN